MALLILALLQRIFLRSSLMLHLGGGQRAPDEEPLQDRHVLRSPAFAVRRSRSEVSLPPSPSGVRTRIRSSGSPPVASRPLPLGCGGSRPVGRVEAHRARG